MLVAEDEALIRWALTDALRREGFAVIEACNAAEALDIIRAGITPEALLTDILMPGPIDGLHLAALVDPPYQAHKSLFPQA